MSILVITLGGSPQLVTETVYGIHYQGGPLPGRVAVCTTAHGERLCRYGDPERGLSPLLGEGGIWPDFLRSIGCTPEQVPIDIIVPHHGGGPIKDVRSPEEVAAFADSLLTLLRGAKSRQEARLHVSLAGGRKTMSFIAGTALSLVADHADRLSHVLIKPDYLENSAYQFWWPLQKMPAGGTLKDGTNWRAADAVIDLHDVPFLPMGAFVPAGFGQSYSQTVALASATLDPATPLRVHTETGEISFGPISHTPEKSMQFALLHLAALARLEQWDDAKDGLSYSVIAQGSDNEGSAIFEDRFFTCLKQSRQIWNEEGNVSSIHDKTVDAINDRKGRRDNIQDWFASELSRLRAGMRAAFPPMISPLIIPGTGLSLEIDPNRIEIIQNESHL